MFSRLALRSRSAPRLLHSRGYAYVPRTYTKAADSKPAAPAKPSAVKPSAADIADAIDPVPAPRAIPETNGTSAFAEGEGDGAPRDWSKSYHGLSSEPFAKDVANILLAPLDPLDVEMKPGALNATCYHHISNNEHRRSNIPPRN